MTMRMKIFVDFVVLAIVALTSPASSSLLPATHTSGWAKKKKANANNLFIHQIPRGGGGNSNNSKSDSSHSSTAIPGVGHGEWWVESADLDIVTDAPLISDIEMLSNMLAEVVKRENPIVYDLYTTFRKHGMDRASLAMNANDADVADSIESFEAMKTLARDISPRDAKDVMKTFGIALNLVNAAEVHHRVRLVRTLASEASYSDSSGSSLNGVVAGPLPNVEDSICGTMEILLNKSGVDSEKIFQRLITQKCEIVLTAHPTEVNRKTLIRKCKCYYIVSLCLCCFVDDCVCACCQLNFHSWYPHSYYAPTHTMKTRQCHLRVIGICRAYRLTTIRTC